MGGKDRGRGRQAGVRLAMPRGDSRPRSLREDSRGVRIVICPRYRQGTYESRRPRSSVKRLNYVTSVKRTSLWAGIRARDKVTCTEPPTDEELEILRELQMRTAVARRESS